MLGNFLKNFGKVKANDLGNSIVELAANVDADAVAQTALLQKLEQHEQIIKQLVEVRKEFEKEKQEYLDIQAVYNKTYNAAMKAQTALESNPDDKEAEQALNELLTRLEELQPKVDKEKLEADESEAYLKEVEYAAKEMGEELSKLKTLIEKQKRDTAKAEMDKERAEKQLERAKALQGLTNSTNKFDVAMNALQAKTNKAQLEADTLKEQAKALTPKKVVDSDAVNRFMSDDKPSESVADRLARLKR